MNRIVLPSLTLGLSLAALLCWAAEPNVDQTKAIAEIEKVGGKVTVDEKNPGKPVVIVDLADSKVTDAGLASLEGLPQLEGLFLRKTQVTDAGLTHLRGLTKLQRLTLEGTQVTDAGLVHLKGLTQVKWLILESTQVTDAGLVHLKGLTQLEWLGLEGPQVTDAGLVHLKGLTQLEGLGLESTKVTDAGLVHLKGLTQLEWLDLRGTQVTDGGLVHLKGLSQLQVLNLPSRVTKAGAKGFQKALPNCTIYTGTVHRGERDDAAATRGSDATKIQGKWRMESALASGMTPPLESGMKPPLMNSITVIFTNKRVTLTGLGMTFDDAYVLDPTQEPKHLDSSGIRDGKTLTFHAVYQIVDDDTMKICHADPGDARSRPTEIETKKGDGRSLMVFKRVRQNDK